MVRCGGVRVCDCSSSAIDTQSFRVSSRAQARVLAVVPCGRRRSPCTERQCQALRCSLLHVALSTLHRPHVLTETDCRPSCPPNRSIQRHSNTTRLPAQSGQPSTHSLQPCTSTSPRCGVMQAPPSVPRTARTLLPTSVQLTPPPSSRSTLRTWERIVKCASDVSAKHFGAVCSTRHCLRRTVVTFWPTRTACRRVHRFGAFSAIQARRSCQPDLRSCRHALGSIDMITASS